MTKIFNHQDYGVSATVAGAQIRNVALDLSQSGDITAAASNKGQIYYNTSTDRVRVSIGTALVNLTNLLESISVGTSNGLSVTPIDGAKDQAISLALATGGAAGAMPSAHYTLVNGATSANTASTLVQRDVSNNFSAGTITANLTGTASNATQLNGQAASYYLGRANHTGTQLASTISDFDSQVRLSRLDQMAAPTSAVSFNTQRITAVASPTQGTDAANKEYVDSVATGLDFKQSVRVATTADLGATYTATAGASGRGQITGVTNTVDGVTLAAGDRILVKNQTAGAANGIYTVTTVGTGANGVWDRATDFDSDSEVTSGSFVFVAEGTSQDNSGWVLGTNDPIVIGGGSGTSLSWVQFSGTGAGFTPGNGINITGGVISAVGTTNRISVGAGGIDIAAAYVGQASITTLGTITTGVWNGTDIAVADGGTGASTAAAARTNLGAPGKYTTTLAAGSSSYSVTHGLALGASVAQYTAFTVTAVDQSTKQVVVVDVTAVDSNNISVTTAYNLPNAVTLTVTG